MYQIPDMNVWRGRVSPDASDRLLHQIIQQLDMTHDLHTGLAEKNYALLGFCCDEGVRRNFGRTGARQAPDLIRKTASGIAVHFDLQQQGVMDAGNVLCHGTQLESAQRMLGDKVAALLHHGITPIVLGGGHETAFGHFLGLRKSVDRDRQIGIVNLDAHLNVRTYEQGAHSGSAYRQIAEMERDAFHYLPVGIRPESNISSLFAFMEATGQDFIQLCDIYRDFDRVVDRISAYAARMDHIYLSIDMDCFPSSHAPGVSAAAPNGMMPYHAIEIIRTVQASAKMLSVDLLEANPEYDIDNRTVKLAAELIYHILHN